MIILYDYPRSSACIRVKVALNLKKLPYEIRPVHLLNEGGEQHHEAYRQLNPQSLVPTLVHDGLILTQSIAIMEYLEETFPAIPILPYDSAAKAYVREITCAIACDLHPLNNLRVLNYLKQLGFPQEDQPKWTHHWLQIELSALDKKISDSIYQGRYCYQNQLTMADACVFAQLRRASALGFDVSPFFTLNRLNEHYQTVPELMHATS